MMQTIKIIVTNKSDINRVKIKKNKNKTTENVKVTEEKYEEC